MIKSYNSLNILFVEKSPFLKNKYSGFSDFLLAYGKQIQLSLFNKAVHQIF